MRQFSKPTSLGRLSLEARILYTGFAAFLLIGYATSAWLYADDDLGASPRSVVRYYLGAEDQRPTEGAPQAPAATVELELPPDTAPAPAPSPEPQSLRFAKPPRQVMETFHFHLFSMPVCLLIIGHLFMMCSLPMPWKASVIGGATLATLLHVLAPPLVRFGSPRFAVLFFPSAALMALSWTYMTAAPIWEMWRPHRPRPPTTTL